MASACGGIEMAKLTMSAAAGGSCQLACSRSAGAAGDAAKIMKMPLRNINAGKHKVAGWRMSALTVCSGCLKWRGWLAGCEAAQMALCAADSLCSANGCNLSYNDWNIFIVADYLQWYDYCEI